jgi:hypothetical protein
MTIAEIKSMLQESEGVPAGEIRLVYGGKEMGDS